MTAFRVEVDANGHLLVEADGLSLATVARLLDVFADQLELEPVSPVTPVREPQNSPKPVAAPKRRIVVEPFGCDDCDRTFAQAHGLAVHRSRTHKANSANSVTVKAEPHTNGNAAHRADERLFCDGCKFSCGRLDFQKLRSHTMSQHDGRLPSELERTPRTADERRTAVS